MNTTKYFLVCRSQQKSRPDIPLVEASTTLCLDTAAAVLNLIHRDNGIKEYAVVRQDVEPDEERAILLAFASGIEVADASKVAELASEVERL